MSAKAMLKPNVKEISLIFTAVPPLDLFAALPV
jgi:hypothetical protein